jgi:hypothetical protein
VDLSELIRNSPNILFEKLVSLSEREMLEVEQQVKLILDFGR